MANETFTATQATVLATDNDAPDGVIDPGDVVTTTVTITNNSTTAVAATGVQFTETLDGMTIVDQLGDDINVSPIAFDDAYNVVGNTTFVVSAANGILNGSTAIHVTLSADAEFFTNTIGANAATQTHIVTTGVIDTAGGSVTLNADGSFTYTPDAGFTGTDSFTYALTDAGLDGNFATAGDNLTGTGTVTFNVEDTVWFIDNTAPGSLNLGTQDNPFTSIAAFNAVNDGVGNHPAAGDIVYLRAGTYTEADGINLLNNQTLVGQGENLVVNHSLGGNITLETGSAGQTPVIVVTGAGNQGIQLAQGNTISGLDVGMNNASAVGIADGGGTVGTLTISNVGVGVGSNLGSAIDIDQGGTLNVLLESVTSTGAARGVDLGTTTGVSGTFGVSGTTTINDATDDGIAIANSSLNASFAGLVTIINDVGAATVADGVNLGTGAGAAGNTGTYSFNGGVNITVNGTNAFGFRGQSSGTVNITDVGTTQITSQNGTALLINPTTLNATLDSITSGGGTDGISLTGMSGSLTVGTVSLNNQTGDGVAITNSAGSVTINGGSIGNTNDPGSSGVDISGGAGNVTIAAAITDTTAAGAIVEITGRTGGTVTLSGNLIANAGVANGIDVNSNTGGTINFTGQTETLSTAGSAAVSLTSNSGATINFNPTAGGNGLDISTTSGTGFNATGGGTVTVQGAGNTISSGTGTALNVANTTIGAEDLTFQSISSSGGSATGIILDTTGTGGLHVTGNGSAGTGGTIANKTGADGSTSTGVGIYLNNASDVQLDWMQLNDLQNFGIRGNNVTGFSFDNSVISGTNGTAAGAFDEAAISFNNLLGSASISDSNIGNGFEYILKVLNSSGTLNRLTIDNTDFGTNNTALGGDAVQIVASNTATVNVTVTDSGFTNAREDLFNAVATQSADMDVVFRDNTLSNNHTNKVSAASNILVFSTSNGDVTYDISHNTLTSGATGSSIAVAKGVPDTGSGGTMTGTVNANTIGVSGVVGSGSEFTGIFASALGSGTHTTAITNNTIYHYNEEGIFLKANDPLTGGNSVLNATVTGNITTEPDSLAFAGLWVLAGSGSGTETNTVNVVLGNVSNAALQNDFANGDPANGSDVFLQESGSGSVINLSRAGSAAGTAAGVIQDDNVGTPTVVAAGTVNLVNTLPPTPPPVVPLLAATGGVEAAPLADNTPPADDTPPQDNAGAPGAGDPPSVAQPGGEPPAPPAATPHPIIVDDGLLSQVELDYFVDAAIARWSATGLTTAQLDALKAMSFGVADLSGLNLGSFTPAQITLDADAAGHGWYLDGTPRDDAEFGNGAGTRLITDPTQAPAGHYDLLTTVMHEMGHALGLGDRYEGTARDALMYGWLFTGERRVPGAGEADGAVAGSITTEEFAGSPIVVTPANSTTGNFILPAGIGKTVTIQWQATVDPQTNQLIDNPVNTGTVTATNTLPAFPDASTNTVTTTLDTLVLGGTVWNDDGAGGGIAANGIKDGTEPGVSGVTLSLFVDADDNNVPDSPASPLVTGVLTNGSGDYSFTALAPGNYIVRVDAGNFTGAGALVSLQLSPVTSPEPPDPDTPDVDNDDNGSRTAGQPAFSNAITLAYNTEPTAGTGNDTNTTLDFGFLNNPIQVVKFVNGQDADSATGPHVAAGSTVTFTYVVTDTGGAPLANVALTDDKLGTITSFTGDTNGDGLLDPTETWTYTATATALAGQQTNVGTVTGQDANTLTTVTDDNPANYFGDAPAINIVKFVNGQDADSAPGAHVAAGSTVTFTYVVTDTGNVPLSGVVVQDDNGTVANTADDFNPTFSGGDANANGLLDLTETWTYTHTATALAGQQTNVGTVTGQDANSPPGTTVTDDNPANYFGDPIQIVKFVNGQDADSATGPHVAAGSTVTFTYVVTDAGGAPVANVAVTDDKLGPITSFTGDTNGDGLLDPTETWTYTATATALAGQQTNVGTVTGQDVNTLTTVTDDNPANYFGDAAAINIVKFVNGQDADSATGPHVAAGSTVTFTYVVTDTGNVPLSGVVVRDDNGTVANMADDFNPAFSGGDTNANGLLDLTETWTYTHTATALAGQQTNVGTVTGQDVNSPPGTTVTDDNPANYFGDPIQIVKFVNGQDADSATGPHVAAGSTVTFTYVVTDTGGAPVANVAVTDDKLGPITSFTGDTNGDGLLDPTETWTYTATATALAGQQTNVGTVTGQDFNTLTTVTDDNPANYFGDAPAINIVKFVNGQDADSATGPHVAPGSTVTFTYVVTDTGNVPLANVTLTDDKLGLITSFTGDANANGLLDLTETWTYTATATALAGQQTNVGTVTGQDANSPPGTTVTDDNPANYFGDFAAGIQIVKFVNGQDADSATGPHVAAGSTVTFTYVVTDTGGVPVANVALTDDKLGPITSFTGDTNGDGLLDPTETWTYTAAAIALAGQQTNVGTVTGQDVNTLTTVTDDNPANYFGDAAGINLVKFVNGQDADSATGPHVAAGSTVTFTYVVTDTGNVPLANVTLTDDKLGAITSFTGDTNANGLLDLTETWIYTQTATALAGQQTNVGTVTGQDANSPPGTTVTDDNPANYFGDAAAVPPPASDFDGDSKSDIAWQSNNGTAAIWLMDGTNSTFVGAVGPFNPGPTWHIKATGDFNGDSKADIVWQHDNGLTAMWLMDGTNATFVGAVGPFNPEAPWDIKATGDFNGDGKDDIIWQHDNGLTAMWQMDGTNATFVGAVGPFNPGATWEIKGTGDFNGDGKDDIIWQGDDGTASMWLMDGTNATFVGAIGPFNPGPSWEIKGTGDFNGDGKSDIIWQGQDGTPAIWLMDGTNATFVGAIGPFNPGPSWEIKGTGDFNGDGKDDIIWQGQDGTPAIWLMDGTDVVSIGAAGSFNPGSDWHVII